jgi:hypothetical protein
MNADRQDPLTTAPGVDPALEVRLRRAAQSFVYPATPDLRRAAGPPGRQARRQFSRAAWAAIAAACLLLAMLLVSPARARVLEWLRIGAVRVVLSTPTAGLETPAPAETARPADTLPAALPTLPPLSGETTLAQAAIQAPFAIKLPAYPPNLGEPQRVYFQHVEDTPFVILVWSDPPLALYQVGQGELFEKRFMKNVEETFVHGEWALWVEGPYLLTMTGGQVEQQRVIAGRTLVWVVDGLTYRLETDLPLEEARDIAESLQPYRQP